MTLIFKPNREPDSYLSFTKPFAYLFWWEEQVLMANYLLYKFDSDLKFFFEYGGTLHRAYLNEEETRRVQSAYAEWLVEKELTK